MLFTIEQFKNLVKKSITFQKHKGQFSYVALNNNEYAICLYCQNKMQTHNTHGMWYLFCDCIDAKNMSALLDQLFEERRKIDEKINNIYNCIEEKALDICKKHVTEVIMPKFWKDFDDDYKQHRDDILKLENIN